MDKVKKLEEYEIPKEFLKPKQVEEFVKQGIIEVLNYSACPNCGIEFLEDEGCKDCGYGVLNNYSIIPKIKKVRRFDFLRTGSNSLGEEKKEKVRNKSILEKININLKFKVTKINQIDNKIKSIEFYDKKNKYIIYIENYEISNKQMKERHGGDYNLIKIQNINYQNLNIAKMNGKNTQSFHQMNYFKNLGGFKGLNELIKQVLRDFHDLGGE